MKNTLIVLVLFMTLQADVLGGTSLEGSLQDIFTSKQSQDGLDKMDGDLDRGLNLPRENFLVGE